ncbi:MAG: alpha-glucan family phosphorylase [Candidatus Jettenia sp.]|uniref:Glycogen phosphorylase n=1 Tax=Candidatus Jettenia caeni TaxID=247490 RepID=I3INI3_9BACT|nr:alpha-glucan family phosphorylase [Candidatus Jettenia sp. AMX1]MBC6927900.1 alpha-glucan family phosphorylase [Candidatus Jettenia sp.]WKZ14959.1 MAG: alpha-glucan family phosphorylase [Candidatus Jettenia caeni]KAA0248222.1 MAG: alpha-glucan family phosphorylase [Candidatus Jettenia sp. AMX1]MCE7879503.1 alpha-glucan family phosphorylase [Candidatus Jettenia sp. AMX1]MDL1937872.1 alpha-glucan family phosphorylase [Candidatus Jettenia sp. AMX1]
MNNETKIAYFSMEIGLSNDIPTYSGGLGVLAGDTIKSCADLKIPLVAVTLISKKGYFRQDIDSSGRQTESPIHWDPSKFMIRISKRVMVFIEGRKVFIQAWSYKIKSITGGEVDVLYLDTDVEENTSEDREITAVLYGGDDSYRLKQEVVLGIGGVRMLRALGYHIKKYHMNEGHASLLTLELLLKNKRDVESVWHEQWVWDFDAVKDLCVFTTHTPIEAGHDRFSYDLVKKVLGDIVPLEQLKKLGGEKYLDMTLLALNLSEYVNGVAKKHGEVSKNLFPGYEIYAITNGVHSFTWTCQSFKQLYDKYIPGWANEPELFVRAETIPDSELWQTHLSAKKDLIEYVKEATSIELDPHVLTIGFARRFTSYKRADLLFLDMEQLLHICEKGKLQVIYAGKAHPKDGPGKDIIKKINDLVKINNDKIKIIFLKDYNIKMALKLISGVDVWLNTPQRPREASGTSGMKASHNGVINFSILDGWWIEGHIEGITGWSIGPKPTESSLTIVNDKTDAEDLYNKLENIIIPMYYHDQDQWIKVMKNSIGKIAYYFNSHRMMRRYVTEAYLS